MCDARIGEAVAKAREQAGGKPKKDKDLLIADKDSEGRPVGRGGRVRERAIMKIVDGAQSGLTIPE